MIHKPVLLGEAIENLNLKKGSVVVDGTLGAGGHAIEILKKILPGGKLIAIDWDAESIENFKGIISKKELIGISDNYANLENILRGLARLDSARQGIKTVDAILIDLGFNSDQIENAERGFSFQKDGPLDMRYSPQTQKNTAADVINNYPEERLIEIFRNYGEEKFARSIARAVASARKEKRINRTGELVEIISAAAPEKYQKNRIHPATRVFQALRIEVNQELENLKTFLDQAAGSLANGGRLAVISFHSLEDRIVKNFFKLHSKDCVCPPNFPKCVCQHRKSLKIITKKPIIATGEEIKTNPRSRSAKMRVAEKIT
ncbi:16S rRNA (cytosine(1402)-N(4))-methyltransferase RsmH [bacterium]|nr:MAG: 16S rRNA (cytosine(1402)-N(4))-methyltransferase RsmH [bacterium]